MIKFQNLGQTINVYWDRILVCYFDTTAGTNPPIRLIRSDINLEILTKVVEAICSICHHKQPDNVEWMG